MAVNKYQERMESISESFKILRLRFGNENAKLLALPREIRDQIWEYVVDEPDLLHRRHHPKCTHYDPFAAYETPPALIMGIFELRLRAYRPDVTLADAPTCKKLCVRRQSMGLLRVCKMVSREAIKMFYEKNTLCFMNRDLMVETIQKLNQTSRGHVRSLALQLRHPPPLLWYERWPGLDLRDPFFHAICMLPNLRHIEAPPSYFSSALTLWDRFPGLSRLQRVTLTQHQLTGYHFGGEERYVYLSVSRDYKTGPQQPESWKFAKLLGSMMDAQVRFEIFEFANLLEIDSGFDPPGPWMRHIRDELFRTRPTHCERASYTFVAKLRDGTKQPVSVLGLPRESSEVRHKKRMKSINAGIAARKAQRMSCPQQEDRRLGLDDEEEDPEEEGDFVPHHASAHRRSPVDKRVDHQAVLDERRETRRAQARREEHASKKAAKKAVSKGQRELETEKKASKKRVGRR